MAQRPLVVGSPAVVEHDIGRTSLDLAADPQRRHGDERQGRDRQEDEQAHHQRRIFVDEIADKFEQIVHRSNPEVH